MFSLDPITTLQLLAVGFGSTFCAARCVPFVIEHAHKAGLLDRPGKRSELGQAADASQTLAKAPVASLGGFAVAAGTAMGLGVASSFEIATPRMAGMTAADSSSVVAVVLGALIMMWVGFRDDLGKAAEARRKDIGQSCGRRGMTELSGKIKLVFQIAVALVLWLSGLAIETIEPIPGWSLELGFMSLPMTMLWVVGLINAINLIDGMDGLAGGVCTIIAATFGMVAWSCGAPLLGMLCLALAGACLGFLRHNYQPARIYLGDTGSLFLGTMLVGLGVATSFEFHGSATFSWQFALAFLLPIADTFQVMVRRILRGESVMMGDHKHVHHMLCERVGLQPAVASPVLYLVVLAACIPLLVLAFEATGIA